MKLILAWSLLLAQCSVAAQNPTLQNQAVVHVYRYKEYQGMGVSPSVFMDETELARTVNGRRFVVLVTPGKHRFLSNDKQAGAFLDCQAAVLHQN